MTTKTCSKCDEEKAMNLFVKDRNICKECAKTYKTKNKDKKDKMDPDTIVQCIKCKEKKKYELFIKRSNRCKDCNNIDRRERAAKKKDQLDPNGKKTCTNCKEEQTEADFEIGSNNCKTCRNDKKKQRLNKYAKEMPDQKMCKKCCELQSSDNFRLGENVCYECTKSKLYEWRQDNAEQFHKICAKYRSKDGYQEKNNKYKRDNYNNNPQERKRRHYRMYLRDYIFRGKVSKKIDTIVGLSQEQMRDWLEFNFKPGMTWDNYGTFWNLDHVKPCCAFDLTEKQEIYNCFSWKNTLPVYCKENLEKFNKVGEHDASYVEKRGELFMHPKTQLNIRRANKLKQEAKLEEYFKNISDSDCSEDEEKVIIVKTMKFKRKKLTT